MPQTDWTLILLPSNLERIPEGHTELNGGQGSSQIGEIKVLKSSQIGKIKVLNSLNMLICPCKFSGSLTKDFPFFHQTLSGIGKPQVSKTNIVQ